MKTRMQLQSKQKFHQSMNSHRGIIRLRKLGGIIQENNYPGRETQINTTQLNYRKAK